MPNRLHRVRELLKREISSQLSRDMNFQNALVTVNDVDVTPDLRQAHVYVGIVGDEKAAEKAFEKILERRVDIQQAVGSRVVLKNTPRLHFTRDDSVERGVNVVSILGEIGEVPEEHEYDPESAPSKFEGGEAPKPYSEGEEE